MNDKAAYVVMCGSIPELIRVSIQLMKDGVHFKACAESLTIVLTGGY